MRFLKTFKEVYESNLPKILRQDIFRLADIGDGVLETHEVTPEYMKRVYDSDLPDFENYLGGDVKVVESEEDLQFVTGVDLDFADEFGRWPTIKDKPLVWDSAGFLDGEWAYVYLAWTDSGGDVYYIPKEFWEISRMTEQVQLTNRSWNENNS
jgi:hypothetical protein